MDALIREFAAGLAETARGLALAKRASGSGRRGAAVTEAQSGGDDLTAALSALAKEFRELADRGRKICDTPHTVLPFGRWEEGRRHDLLEALLRRDLEAAEAILTEAKSSLVPLLENAQLDRAIGEQHREKALIPGWHRM